MNQRPNQTVQEQVQNLGNTLFTAWEDTIYTEIAEAANSVEGVTAEQLQANATLLRQVAVRCFAVGVTAMAKHMLGMKPLAGTPEILPPAPETLGATQ